MILAVAMTLAEFAGLLHAGGLNDQQAAELFGVHNRTIRRWRAGGNPVPGAVADKLRRHDASIETAVRQFVKSVEDTRPRPEEIRMLVYASDCDFARYQPYDAESLRYASAYRAFVDRVRLVLGRLGIRVRLVELRPEDYEAWRSAEARADGEDTRNAWAALQLPGHR